MKAITIEMLRQKKACKRQVNLAERTFGSVIKINKTNFNKAVKAGLDVSFCSCFLSDPLWEEYEKANDLLWEECKKVRGQALLAALLRQVSA